jgi:hypothetical protein
MRLPRWRLATWVMILWTAFIAALSITWLVGDECGKSYNCDSPVEFWVAMLVGIWSIVFTLLFVWWYIGARRRKR